MVVALHSHRSKPRSKLRGTSHRLQTGATSDVAPWTPALREALKPRKRMTVHAWADAHRFLSSDIAAEPGPYRSMRTPYVRGILDAAISSEFDYVAVQKSSQVGLTEAANNLLGYWICEDTGPCLYVLPSEDDIREEKNRRLKPLVEESPALARKIPHAGWATDKELTLNGMMVMFAWAGSARTVSRRPCRYVIMDEMDNCESQSSHLGDTVSLCEARTTTFGFRRKIFLPSTPSTELGSIHRMGKQYGLTRFHVPCPKCGAYQFLKYAQIKIPEQERDPDRIVVLGLAEYECEHCRARLSDGEHKRWMIDRGLWLRPGQQIAERLPVEDAEIADRARMDHPHPWSPTVTGDSAMTRKIVFHIWAAYSPWVTWSEIVAKHLSVLHDREKLRVWTNTVLGEAFLEAAEATEASVVHARRRGMPPRDMAPADARVLIVGADVQKDHLYYVVRAFGDFRRSWLLREGIMPDLAALWRTVALRPFETEDRRTLTPRYLGIDSRYRMEEVFDFARANAGVYPIFGESSQRGEAWWFSRPDRLPDGRRLVAGMTVYHVNTGYYKHVIHRGLKTPAADAGAFNVHAHVSRDYCTQLTNEQFIRHRPKGGGKVRLAWTPKSEGAAVHYLDCEVYAMAVADITGTLALQPDPADPPPARREKREGFKRPDGLPYLITERIGDGIA